MVRFINKQRVDMKNILIISMGVILFLLLSCKEEDLLKPYGDNPGGTPRQVSNVRVENISGGAILKYDLPKEADLLYVKAVYNSSLGIEKEVTSSAFVDSLKIVGLGNTNEYPVEIYCVDHFENKSLPVEAIIKPLKSPVQNVFESLGYFLDFGGFVVNFENKTGADVAIYVLTMDSTQTSLEGYDALYTGLTKGVFSVRGLPNKENTFGLYVRDRYDNMSDTMIFKGTPMREDALDKKLFNIFQVAGDLKWDFFNGVPEKAWDQNVSNGNYAHTDFPVEFPHRITIDLGVQVRLSRFRFWQRPGDDVLFQHGAPKHYKVYGRSEKPESGSASDPLAGWTLLMECNSFKPSGLPLGQNSSEDVEYNAKGEEFSFPRDISSIRYVRFEMLESWSGMKCSTIGELSFWGEIQ